ncbi:MAG: hypothetical protein WCG78_07225 [Candidatus Omnitrophota bacterium]
MDKAKLELTITLSLTPVLIFVVYTNIIHPHPKEAVKPPNPLLAIQAEAAAHAKSARSQEVAKLKAMAWKRDPFIVGGGGEGNIELVLNGIVWDEKSPYAIINNAMVRSGDEVGGSKVVEIHKDKVVMNDGTNNFDLNLAKGV